MIYREDKQRRIGTRDRGITRGRGIGLGRVTIQCRGYSDLTEGVLPVCIDRGV
jgi:hypothetical protein